MLLLGRQSAMQWIKNPLLLSVSEELKVTMQIKSTKPKNQEIKLSREMFQPIGTHVAYSPSACTFEKWLSITKKKKITWFDFSSPLSCRCLSEHILVSLLHHINAGKNLFAHQHGAETDYFFASEGKKDNGCLRVCHCCRASLGLENEVADWCWNRPYKSAFIPLLHLLFFFVSF